MSLEGPKKEKLKSSVERVVGVPKFWEEAILAHKGEVFDVQDFPEAERRERQKTPEDIQIIDIANFETNELRRQYGMDDFDILPKNIHIVGTENWRTEDAGSIGFYEQKNQAVAIKDEYTSRLKFLSTVIHEMLHFKSHNAMQAALDKYGKLDWLHQYRNGFTVISRDGGRKYFTELNEAITEELTKRLMFKIVHEFEGGTLFADEIKNTRKLIEEISEENPGRKSKLTEDIIYAAPDFPKKIEASSFKKFIYRMIFGSYLSAKTENYVYSQQRIMLKSLIEKIFRNNPGKFKDEKEVFDIFAKAYMTGNLLPMGRLIEDAFGKGVFRKIGEIDMRKKKPGPKRGSMFSA